MQKPAAPDSIQSPAGEELVFMTRATGFQIYVCQPDANGKPAWPLKAPGAELYKCTGATINGHNTSPGSFKFALDRPLRFAGVLIVLIMMVSIQAGSRSSDLFNVSMQNVNSLQGILRFGTENHIPVGIILNSQISLCNSPRNVSLKSVSIGTVMDRLLVASEYVWSMDEGVLMVRPRNLPESSSYVLNLKFERFTGMKSTIQGLGIILSGYIHGKLRPTEGYAGDILQSPDSEQVGPLDLSNATVTQIANNIVSLDGKGAWVLYPVPEDTSQIASVRRLYIYGYSDDSRTIADLSCDNPNGP